MRSLGRERCWAEIDRAALLQNARLARERAGTGLVAVVKANGYGHGMIEVARTLQGETEVFGVANLAEAEELRGGGIDQPILLLGPALPDERAAISAGGFIASISSLEEAEAFAAWPTAVNFAIDTGMGRMGCWHEDAIAVLEKICRLPQLRLHSISTHLPAADEDQGFTESQLSQFEELVRQIRARLPGNYRVHALLSAGILRFGHHRFDLVRAGLMLYGSSSLSADQKFLKPAMTFKARIALLRDLPMGRSLSYGRTFITARRTRVATISVGYADGFPRSLSNRGASVLVGGRRCPVLGRITMDLTLVDVTELPKVDLGDEVVLIGKQGEEEIPATEMAEHAGTIPWEIFTGIGSRVRRVYV